MRLVIGFVALALLGAACTSSEPDAAPPPTSMQTTTTLEPTATTTSMASAPEATTTTTTEVVDTATTATTVWVDPPPTTSTTIPAPDDNEAPIVEITSPGNLSSHVAAFDPDSQAFRAVVSMSASVSDPDNDQITVDWFSSESGYLGTGEFITASLITIYDSSQPFISAKATDEHGAVSEHRIQIIVWVPSDT